MDDRDDGDDDGRLQLARHALRARLDEDERHAAQQSGVLQEKFGLESSEP